MSVVNCDSCQRNIDSDFDDGCFVYTNGIMHGVLCERCKENKDGK